MAGRQIFNNDPRWQWVDKLSDLMAVLLTIETHRRYIMTHAANSDVHNVVLNLKAILQEARDMCLEINKLKRMLGEMQAELASSIYQTERGALLVKLADAPGSADVGHAYMITEGAKGRRFRRVRLSDYVGPESEGR